MSIFFKKFLFFCALTATVAGPSIEADSLSVSPFHPTTSDSIRLSIIVKYWNCCAHYFYDSTAVTLLNDSTITLGFTASLVAVCPCPANPVIPVLNYKRGPLPAGNYSVYEESQSCTGQICPEDALIVVQALIGKFTILPSTATFFQQKSVPLEKIGKVPGNVRMYDIRGAIVSSNVIGASKQTSGVYFVKTNGRTAVKMKIWH